MQRVWYRSEFQTNSVVWECGTGKKSIFIKNNEKICDKNLSIKKSLGYSYTVFILKESKSFLYWRYWQFVISKLLLLKGSWIKQKTQSTLTNYSGWKWIDSWRLHLCSMNRNMTGKPDGACFWNVLKDVKNTAAYGKDWTEKVMAPPPYNQETCYPLSSFQDPHEPWYEQPMFNPVQLGYVVMYYVLWMVWQSSSWATGLLCGSIQWR